MGAAVTFVDRALILNPNLAEAWWASGWTRVYLGEPDLAIKHFARAMRLSPLDPHMISMQGGTAFAHFIAERDDEALSWAEKALCVQANMASLEIMTASNALAGRITEAQKTMARLRDLNPALRVSNVKDWVRFGRPKDLARFDERSGLRLAWRDATQRAARGQP